MKNKNYFNLKIIFRYSFIKMNSSKVTYFQDGITIRARGDKINGKYTEYWPNGKKHIECSYTNGKSNGDEIYYDKDGKTVYDNNKCIFQ